MASTHKSQTSQVLSIPIDGSIFSCQWKDNMASKNGEALLLVRTNRIANGAELEATLYNESAKKVGQAKGKVVNDACTIKIPMDHPVGTTIKAIVKLPKHSAEGVSGPLQVIPNLSVKSFEWLDGQGKPITEITDETLVKARAKVPDLPEGLACTVSLEFVEQNGKHTVVQQDTMKVRASVLEINWMPAFPRDEADHRDHQECKKEAGKYEHPKVFMNVSLADRSVKSSPIPYSSWANFTYEGCEGSVHYRFADGREETHTVPDDYCIRLKGCGVGKIDVVKADLRAKAVTNKKASPRPQRDNKNQQDVSNSAQTMDETPVQKIVFARGWFEASGYLNRSDDPNPEESQKITRRLHLAWVDAIKKCKERLEAKQFIVETFDHLTVEEFLSIGDDDSVFGLYLYSHGIYKPFLNGQSEEDSSIPFDPNKAGIVFADPKSPNSYLDSEIQGLFVSGPRLSILTPASASTLSHFKPKKIAYIQVCYNRDIWHNRFGIREVSQSMDYGKKGNARYSASRGLYDFTNEILGNKT